MGNRTAALAMLLLLLAGSPAAGGDVGRVFLRCGMLIDGAGELVRGGNPVVVVRGERIEAVGWDELVPDDQEVVDLTSSTCLPGLIDAHAHPLIATDDYQVDHLRRSSGFKALRALQVLQRMLAAGWTSVRIPGDADVHYAHLDAKRAIDEGLFVGPRVTGAGHYLSITGGGGDLNFLAPEHRVVADGLVVDGVDEIRKAVRREVKHGSEWIKVLASGAMMSAGDNPLSSHFSPEELTELVREADRLGVPVMAHAHPAEAIKRAARAGVRSIEHGTFIDEEGIALLVERGIFLVPTLYVGDYYLDERPESEAQREFVEIQRRYREQNHQSIAAAIRGGVQVGVGTDYVGFPVEQGVRELALLVKLGMTPMQAIQAATRTNARLLGWEDRLGTIEPGKLADIIAVPGLPLEDISVLERVSFVMRGGRIVRHDATLSGLAPDECATGK